MVVVDATPLLHVWWPSIAALLQPCTFVDNLTCPPLLSQLLPMKCHHCCLLHVTFTAVCAKELWVHAAQCHHRRAGPPLSPQDGALDLPTRCAVKSAKQQSNYDKQRKQMRGEMQEYLLTYMVQCHALIMTEYARIFCYYYFWRTFSFHSNTVTLYLMISCEGELRYGK